MPSTALEILNRAALGAVVVFMTMSVFQRSPSQAAIATQPTPKMRLTENQPRRLGPAPAMLGQPMTFDGDTAGQYPTEAWRTYMNDLLAKAGYGPIDGCAERMRTEAFVYQENCDGEMVFVSGIYRATASMLKPAGTRIDVRSGAGLPPRDIVSSAPSDIVDRSASQRVAQVSAYDGSAAAVTPSPVARPGQYVDESVPILSAPVPQTRRRGARSAAAE